jgi:hypothetical protein
LKTGSCYGVFQEVSVGFGWKEEWMLENVELCPTLFCKGDKIVEVALTEWKQTGPMTWTPFKSEVTVGLLEPIDRIIFETPVGCFQLPTNCQAGSSGGTGDTLTLYMGGDLKQTAAFRECRDKPSFTEIAVEEETWAAKVAGVKSVMPKIFAKSG